FVAREFVRRTDVPTPVVSGQPAPVVTPLPSGQAVQRLPGFFCSDADLANIPLPATGLDVITLGDNAGSGARRLASIWNRYGGLLQVLATKLGIDAAVAVAVLAVESGGDAFVNGRMIIRFENHLFFDEWGKDHQDLFFQHFAFVWQDHTWRPSANLPLQKFHGNQEAEWQVLTFAMSLNDTAAKLSTSMGAPQILGRNHKRVGYPTVQDMFNAFSSDERAHILGLFDFIRADADMVQALRSGNYLAFAGGYNGPGQPQFYADLIGQSVQGFTILRTAPVMASFSPR
ncbi:MAG TPA: N-acetylmuramidase domain-containing protein, partial [Caldilineaceae bacterium]|nr:N-acetylmuramidase domain-containing protein [Caldilineaceae bacterium]